MRYERQEAPKLQEEARLDGGSAAEVPTVGGMDAATRSGMDTSLHVENDTAVQAGKGFAQKNSQVC